MDDPNDSPSDDEDPSDSTTETFDRREQAIIDALRNEPEGLQFNVLAERVKDKMSRNTLQKKLDGLIAAGVIGQDPPEEEWRKGQAKQYILTEGAKLPEGIVEDWKRYREIAVDRWRGALDAYDPDTEWTTDALQDFYEEYADLREDDLMFEVTEKESVDDVYRMIATELYRYHTERIFGAAYIGLVGREDEMSERTRTWVMLQTYDQANKFRAATYKIWDESAVPGPDLGE